MAEEADFQPPWLLQKPADMFPEDWVRLCEAYWLYTNMYFRHTEITRRFLHPLNVAYIVGMVNRALTELVKTKFICREFYTGEFQQSLADTAYGNSSYANTNNQLDVTARNVDELTGKFIDMWITDLWLGWRNQARFQQYALEDNRMKFFPYPPQEPITGHSVTYDIGTRTVSSPWRLGHADFLLRLDRPTCLAKNRDPTSVAFFFDKILNPANTFERDPPLA